jgi:ATP-dependent Lon protease
MSVFLSDFQCVLYRYKSRSILIFMLNTTIPPQYKKMTVTPLEDLIKGAANELVNEPNKKSKVIRKRSAGLNVNNPELRHYDSDERSYYNKLDDDVKAFISSLEKNIKDLNKDEIPLRFKILMSNIDEKVKAIAIKKLRYLYEMDESTSEYYKLTNWIESLCRVPIGKFSKMAIDSRDTVDEIRSFIKRIRDTLDNTVYGHLEAKDHIIRLIAQWISNPESKGLVIGIQGPAGCGKTTLVKNGICKALELPFAFVALGGASDGSFLDGHSPTYEGSTWGKIVDILMRAECMNPVIYFDELDKISYTYKGDEVVNILVHLTDSTQNDKYQDKFFIDVDFDMSRCLIIFSYNDETLINPILKDRMVKIKTEGYKLEEKVIIAQKYLLPELFLQFKLPEVTIKDDLIKYIITNRIEEEEGVRNLKRALECILSNLNLNVLMSPKEILFPLEITEEMVNKYVKNSNVNSNNKLHSMYI